MNQLDIIFETCRSITGCDLSIKSRKRNTVENRAIYYHIARSLAHGASLDGIGSKTNTDHATVLHGLKMLDVYLKDQNRRELFRKCLTRCGEILETKIDPDRNIGEIIDRYQQTILELQKEIDRLSDIPQLIKELLSLSPEQYKAFETRAEVIIKFLKKDTTY